MKQNYCTPSVSVIELDGVYTLLVASGEKDPVQEDGYDPFNW